MNSIWYALLWKESREQRWKLVTLLVATCLFLPIPWLHDAQGRWAEVIVAPLINVVAPLLLLAVPLVGMFLGAGIAASEQSQRTIGFLQSLPTSTRRIAVIKLFTAIATVLTPCTVAIGVAYVWMWAGVLPNEAASNPHTLELAVLSYGLAVVSLLIWMAAAGVNRNDEVQAGAIGLLVILTCWAALGLFVEWPGINPSISRICYAAAPAGAVTIFQGLSNGPVLLAPGAENPSRWPLIVTALVTHGALIAWYVQRFGRVVPGRRQAVDTLPRMSEVAWLGPPRVRPWTAILWKQTRETMPLAALGAAAILCVSISIASVVYRHSGEFGADFAFAAGMTWMVAGFLVSVVAGIGLLMDDLRPGLHGFWRSRPINPDQWFVIKFTVSLLTTVLTLALPTIIIFGGVVAANGGDASLDGYININLIWLLPILGLLAQVGAFSIAAAAMAFTRQPVTAAIVAILTAIGAIAFSEAYATSAVRLATFIAVAIATATLAAWLAVRNNWGWGR